MAAEVASHGTCTDLDARKQTLTDQQQLDGVYQSHLLLLLAEQEIQQRR